MIWKQTSVVPAVVLVYDIVLREVMCDVILCSVLPCYEYIYISIYIYIYLYIKYDNE